MTLSVARRRLYRARYGDPLDKRHPRWRRPFANRTATMNEVSLTVDTTAMLTSRQVTVTVALTKVGPLAGLRVAVKWDTTRFDPVESNWSFVEFGVGAAVVDVRRLQTIGLVDSGDESQGWQLVVDPIDAPKLTSGTLATIVLEATTTAWAAYFAGATFAVSLTVEGGPASSAGDIDIAI